MTYTIDPAWDYGAEDKDRIAQALNDGDQIGEEALSLLFARVTDTARHYRGLADYELAKPLPAKARQEILRLDRAITDFQESFGLLSEEAKTTLDNIGMEIDGRPTTPAIYNALRSLAGAASTVGAAADAPAKKGQRPKNARRRFVLQLADIWAEAHGSKWPTRRHDWKSNQDYGPFRDFVRACLMPLDDSPQGLDDVIRAVVGMGKKTRAHR